MFALRVGFSRIALIRSAARFRGTCEQHTKHVGNSPGSRSVPYDANWTGDPPRFKSPAELREVYARAGLDLSRPIVASCGSGVTAALDAFALALAGHPDAAVY